MPRCNCCNEQNTQNTGCESCNFCTQPDQECVDYAGNSCDIYRSIAECTQVKKISELDDRTAEELATDVESGCTTTVLPISVTDCSGNSFNASVSITELLKLVDTEPLGTVKMIAGALRTIDGYEALTGQTINQTDYPDFFSCLNITTPTFVLPDGRGKDLISASTTITEWSTGGTDSVTLTNNELPIHTHTATSTVSDPGHLHNLDFPWQEDVSDGSDNKSYASNSPTGTDPLTVSASTTGITVATTVASTGNGQAFSIKNSYVAPGYWYVKVKKGVANLC